MAPSTGEIPHFSAKFLKFLAFLAFLAFWALSLPRGSIRLGSVSKLRMNGRPELSQVPSSGPSPRRLAAAKRFGGAGSGFGREGRFRAFAAPKRLRPRRRVPSWPIPRSPNAPVRKGRWRSRRLLVPCRAGVRHLESWKTPCSTLACFPPPTHHCEISWFPIAWEAGRSIESSLVKPGQVHGTGWSKLVRRHGGAWSTKARHSRLGPIEAQPTQFQVQATRIKPGQAESNLVKPSRTSATGGIAEAPCPT